MSDAKPKGEQFDIREAGATAGVPEGETDEGATRFSELGLFGDSETFGTACLSDAGWQAARQSRAALDAHAKKTESPQSLDAGEPAAPTPERLQSAPEPELQPPPEPVPPEPAPPAAQPLPHPKFTRRFLAWALSDLRSKSGDGEKSNQALAALSRELLDGPEALNAYDFNRGAWWRPKPTNEQLRVVVSELASLGQAEIGGDNGKELQLCLTLPGVIAAGKAESDLKKLRSTAARMWTGVSVICGALIFVGTLVTNYERIAKYIPQIRNFFRQAGH
jgi:hypothetical protein